MIRYNIYDRLDNCYLYVGCSLEAVIEAGHTLTDGEVRKYFKIDKDHHNWERCHRPSKKKRYVFDKCILPESVRYRITKEESDDD